jgi:hypothetical protein
MKQRKVRKLVFVVFFVVLSSAVAHAAGYTDVANLGTPTHDIRFASDRALYVEGLVDGCGISRYCSAGGRTNVP